MDEPLSLIKKLVENTISPEERKLLEEWIQQDVSNKKSFINTLKILEREQDTPFDYGEAYERFISVTAKETTKSYKISNYYKYAAILVLAVLTGYFLSVNLSTAPTDPAMEITSNDFHQVDSDAITITMADGTKKVIKNDGGNTLHDERGRTVAKIENNSLSFNGTTGAGELTYNEIFVPNSKTYKIELSDGTLVWLNSGTRLKFPQNFEYVKGQREVFLEGEAFFDVTKNKNKPFVVKSSNISIEVLGTQFNVNSYENEDKIETTLVEGAVEVFEGSMKNNVMKLSPGFQASFHKAHNKLQKKKVDAQIYTSWIHNKLVINNLKFQEILNRLERKYDVVIDNEAINMDQGLYKGEFTNESIEEVLETIMLSTHFKYEINDKTVRIYN